MGHPITTIREGSVVLLNGGYGHEAEFVATVDELTEINDHPGFVYSTSQGGGEAYTSQIERVIKF